MNEFVKGSSRPKQKESLCEKICRNITHNLCFKKDGRIIHVDAISDKHLFELSKGDYIFGEKHWNYYFQGQAQLGIHHEDDILTSLYDFYGYVKISDEEQIEEVSEILAK